MVVNGSGSSGVNGNCLLRPSYIRKEGTANNTEPPAGAFNDAFFSKEAAAAAFKRRVSRCAGSWA